ncbi:hypothetical protein Nepgr_002430 [Nepenthes gracilis]|uniref:Uncharacterized protein n=1 Tax=Nepenthes gracilis TaxID=150966 RepID=A0AAD3RY95_NEPGR|nr:hypothetical protein Nepgr_002430 [Nepenthes gracilis]
MKKSVLQHTPMTRKQNKPIGVKPVGTLRVIPHDFITQDVTHRSAAHRQAWMTPISLFDRIYRQESYGVDRFLDESHIGCVLQAVDSGGAYGEELIRADVVGEARGERGAGVSEGAKGEERGGRGTMAVVRGRDMTV